MQCDVCEAAFEAEDFSGWVEKMKSHYGETHADVMRSKDTGSQTENMKRMMEWMEEAKSRWNAL